MTEFQRLGVSFPQNVTNRGPACRLKRGRRVGFAEDPDGEPAAVGMPIDASHGYRVEAVLTRQAPGKAESDTLKSDPAWDNTGTDAKNLVERSRNLLDNMHDDDKEEAIDLHEQISAAIDARDAEGLAAACEGLKELLFFVEGK